MAKQNKQFLGALDSISAGNKVAPVAEQAQDIPAAASRYHAPPSRQGKQLVGGHLPPQYKRTLKMLSAETGKSQEQLLRSALDMLFTAQRIELR
jgi:hypothetical protein